VSKPSLLFGSLNVDDPHDLNGDGSGLFTFPYVTIESVLILDPWTLLVINATTSPVPVGGTLILTTRSS
jgi:hypothetical protein